MEFGKVENIDKVIFNFTADNTANLSVLSGRAAQDARLFLGCPIWKSKDWIGQLYPKSAKENQYLHYYSRQFNSIELNTTHYQIPDKAAVMRWAAQAPEGFCFCPKIFQGISHQKKLAQVQHLTQSFCQNIAWFEDKLGYAFLQLPSYFDVQNLDDLADFLNSLPKNIRLAIEFRHGSWFENQQLIAPARELLASFGIATVITDVAGRPDVRHSSLTSPTVMIRFVGNGLHPSDYIRIDQWVGRISYWLSNGLENLYFFIHQPENILCPQLAIYFCDQMAKAWPNSLIKPPVLPDQYIQASLGF